MAQVWVDIKPGVLDDFTLLGTWDSTPTVTDLGTEYAIVVDESTRFGPRSLIYNLISDVTSSDQIEVYVEAKITAYNEAVTTDDNVILGPVAQQSLIDPANENDQMALSSRRGTKTIVAFDYVDGTFAYSNGVTTALAATGTKHCLRMRVDASNFYGRGWISGNTESGTWEVTRTRPTQDTGKSGVFIWAGVRVEITALSFGTDGDSAPTDPIYTRKITITDLKSPNDANSQIANATGVQVKLWVSDDVNPPTDTGAPDFLITDATITNGTMEVEFSSGADVGNGVLGVAKWTVTGTDYFFPIETTVEEEGT